MEKISEIVQRKKIQVASPFVRPINMKWELAKEFGEYVGIKTPVVLRMFRLYGEKNVLEIKSWLKDVPYDDTKGGKVALAIWKLKNSRV